MNKRSSQNSERMRIQSEAGQGTIEYILILTVTVIIIMSLVWQFNTAFKKYADAFFDGYIACLLETGELPGNGECTEEVPTFDPNGGTSLAGSGGSGGGGGGSGSSSGSKTDSSKKPSSSSSSSSNASKKTAANGSGSSGSSSSSGSGGGETGGSGGSSGSGFGGRGNGKQRSTAVATSGAKEDTGAGREPLTAIGSAAQSSARDTLGRARKVSMDRSYGFNGQQSENDQALTAAVSPVKKDENEKNLKPSKVAVDMTRKIASVKDTEESGFSVGGFIRILLIAGILIAIFILFGGQLLQIVKSAEK